MGHGGGSSRIHRGERRVGGILIWGRVGTALSRGWVCLALLWIVYFFWVASRVDEDDGERAGSRLLLGATAGG